MKVLHRTVALAAATLGGGAAISELVLAREIDSGADHTTAVELAERIVRGESDLLIFDLRPRAEFEEFHIPGAQLTTVGELARAAAPRTSTMILYSDGGAHAAQAWILLRMRGYTRVFFLRDGVNEWVSQVMEPRLAVDATAQERAAFQHAVSLSRYFGGTARTDVPRAELRQKIVRRRGC